jgi:hypothetical protein
MMIKVKNFPDRIFAEQAQQTLEREGIPSILQSPDIGFLGAGGSSSLPQGVDLLVSEEFAEKAHEILTALFDGI